MSEQLFYANTQAGLYTSDPVRQVMIGVIAHFIFISLKPMVYIFAYGRIDWIIYFWIGSDYMTTIKHVISKRRRMHVLVVLGLVVSLLVTLAPAFLTSVSKLRYNTYGKVLGIDTTAKLWSRIDDNQQSTPQTDLYAFTSLQPPPLDPALDYSLNPEIYSSVSAPLSLAKTTTEPAFTGVAVQMSDSDNADIEALFSHVGDLGGFGYYRTSLELGFLSKAGQIVPSASYKSTLLPLNLGTLNVNVGDDVIVVSQKRVTLFRQTESNTLYGEVIGARANIGASTSWLLWSELLATQSNPARVSTSTLFADRANIRNSIDVTGCRMVELTNNFTQCLTTVLSNDLTTVTFASVTYTQQGVMPGAISFISQSFKVSTFTTRSGKAILSSNIVSSGNVADKAGTFQSAWLIVPGYSRRDAYSLALASLLTSNDRNELVANGFYVTDRFAQYDVTTLVFVLAGLGVGTVLLQVATFILYKRNKHLKEQDVGFILEYDLVVESFERHRDEKDGFAPV
ncbi:hypothetical protein HDU78_005887 [Chytriomyces hyalinus]|nr:hypothetical protein HDU78_005887 [Chytriomyces hyalinus]